MITVFFATNRNLIAGRSGADFGPGYNPDGPAALRFGFAEIPEAALSDDQRLSDIKITVAAERLDPHRPRATIVGSAEIFEMIRAKMESHERDTVIFVHGYGSSFRNALRHAAFLKRRYDARPFNMVLFSWPSDGELVPLMSYYSDRTDAKASGAAIARAMLMVNEYMTRLRATGRACAQCLHLMAHSMGNYALRHAVQAVRGELGDEPPRLFEHVFLFAADEDDDTFEHDHKLRLLPRLARNVHVYFNPRDLALVVSDKTKTNPDRLGSDGPRLTDDLPRKLTLINCRDVAKTDKRDRLGHDYHRYVDAVVRDINQVLTNVSPEKIKGRRFVPEARAYYVSGSRR